VPMWRDSRRRSACWSGPGLATIFITAAERGTAAARHIPSKIRRGELDRTSAGNRNASTSGRRAASATGACALHRQEVRPEQQIGAYQVGRPDAGSDAPRECSERISQHIHSGDPAQRARCLHPRPLERQRANVIVIGFNATLRSNPLSSAEPS
jgi:hypothetical protein